jgi:hypothetical protein
MAAICGVVHKDIEFRFDRARLRNMRDSMACRGPDGWTEHVAGRAALASRRLCLVDPGESGRAPAMSADGRYALVSDGTVLNYRSLRACIAAGQLAWRHVQRLGALRRISAVGSEREFLGGPRAHERADELSVLHQRHRCGPREPFVLERGRDAAGRVLGE